MLPAIKSAHQKHTPYQTTVKSRGLQNATSTLSVASNTEIPYFTLQKWNTKYFSQGRPTTLSSRDKEQICTYINFMARIGQPILKVK